ncbi:hypothetical protein Tco_0415549 [Tanacetum coccineum]
MLSGSVFSKQYWNEVVATACYTQNRSTIVKRHLKTPYEIFHGRIPNIDFLHVFGCPIYIHKHKDYIGKFDEKADDGYFLGYSLVSKAFRVFNTRKQQNKETYHITFDESTDANKFLKPSVDNINIAESERYPADEYIHHYEHSQCNMDKKSTSGACQLLGGKLVCWSAKKQQYVVVSSAEAEYVVAAGCCANILWMKCQLTNYDIIYEKHSKTPNLNLVQLLKHQSQDVPNVPKAPKPSSQTEKKVPQCKNPGAKTGLRRKHTSESNTKASNSQAGHLEKENLSSTTMESQISLVQSHFQTLEAHLGLLNKVTDTLNRFASILNAHNKGVPSAGKSTASLAEGEKNTNLVTEDAELANLVDLICIDVVEEYHKNKLLYNKYCDKMLKIKKSPKITNCEVLTNKGPITLKIYKEDRSEEVILNLKVNDLHLAEWREVIQACPDKSEKRWKTIYALVKTRLDQLTQTEQELKIDLNKPLKEQDHLNELNELLNKKRKRASDFNDEPRSAKKVKSSVQQ